MLTAVMVVFVSTEYDEGIVSVRALTVSVFVTSRENHVPVVGVALKVNVELTEILFVFRALLVSIAKAAIAFGGVTFAPVVVDTPETESAPVAVSAPVDTDVGEIAPVGIGPDPVGSSAVRFIGMGPELELLQDLVATAGTSQPAWDYRTRTK
jgi:hypothetical protein